MDCNTFSNSKYIQLKLKFPAKKNQPHHDILVSLRLLWKKRTIKYGFARYFYKFMVFAFISANKYKRNMSKWNNSYSNSNSHSHRHRHRHRFMYNQHFKLAHLARSLVTDFRYIRNSKKNKLFPIMQLFVVGLCCIFSLLVLHAT